MAADIITCMMAVFLIYFRLDYLKNKSRYIYNNLYGELYLKKQEKLTHCMFYVGQRRDIISLMVPILSKK